MSTTTAIVTSMKSRNATVPPPPRTPMYVARGYLGAGEHRPVHVIGVSGVDRRPDAELAGDLYSQLRQVAPLPHP